MNLANRWSKLLTKTSQDPGFKRSIVTSEFVTACTTDPSESSATAYIMQFTLLEIKQMKLKSAMKLKNEHVDCSWSLNQRFLNCSRHLAHSKLLSLENTRIVCNSMPIHQKDKKNPQFLKGTWMNKRERKGKMIAQV